MTTRKSRRDAKRREAQEPAAPEKAVEAPLVEGAAAADEGAALVDEAAAVGEARVDEGEGPTTPRPDADAEPAPAPPGDGPASASPGDGPDDKPIVGPDDKPTAGPDNTDDATGARPEPPVGGTKAAADATPGHAFWRRAGRTSAGIVGIAAVAAVAVFGATIAPAPVEAASPIQEIAVAPAQEVWACPGPARLTDPETVGDAQFGPSPVGTTNSLRATVGGGTASGTTASVTALDGSDPRELDPGRDAAVLTDATVDAGTLLTVTPREDGGRAPGAAASIGSITTAGDLRGIAAATCVRPGISQWLVGGSTEVGSSAQLVLQNPGRTPATVQVEVWGPGGRAVLGAGSQHLVGPGQEVVALVEAAAPEQRRTVVHLTATGGLVSAYLQHNTLDGLVPLGVDFVMPGAEPTTSLAVTGVLSTGAAVDDPHAPQLRLLAPGAEPASVRLAVYGKEGLVHLRGADTIRLDAGVVTDVSLGGLPAGSYAITVASDVPVVAGASEDRRGATDPDLLREERQYDRAWIAARATDGPDSGRALGEVALVAGTRSTITIGAVPPPGAETEPSTTTADDEAGFRGTLRSYDDKGTLLGERSVAVPLGTTYTLDAAKIATSKSTARAAVVTLERAGGSSSAARDVSVGWSVLVSGGPPNGDAGSTAGSLISVLLPAVGVPSGETVSVREADAAGLGE